MFMQNVKTTLPLTENRCENITLKTSKCYFNQLFFCLLLAVDNKEAIVCKIILVSPQCKISVHTFVGLLLMHIRPMVWQGYGGLLRNFRACLNSVGLITHSTPELKSKSVFLCMGFWHLNSRFGLLVMQWLCEWEVNTSCISHCNVLSSTATCLYKSVNFGSSQFLLVQMPNIS